MDDPLITVVLSMNYPVGGQGLAREANFDPRRVGYAPLFKKMYGDCHSAGFVTNMTDVVWLPSKYGKSLKFSKINGAATALQRLSDELDSLPRRFLTYLRPTPGTYNCPLGALKNRESTHRMGR